MAHAECRSNQIRHVQCAEVFPRKPPLSLAATLATKLEIDRCGKPFKGRLGFKFRYQLDYACLGPTYDSAADAYSPSIPDPTMSTHRNALPLLQLLLIAPTSTAFRLLGSVLHSVPLKGHLPKNGRAAPLLFRSYNLETCWPAKVFKVVHPDIWANLPGNIGEMPVMS